MAKPYYITSEITGRTYDIFGAIRILNMAQNYFYIQHGVPLMDIELSTARKNGNPLFVFIYNREDTKEAYDLWCKNKQKEQLS